MKVVRILADFLSHSGLLPSEPLRRRPWLAGLVATSWLWDSAAFLLLTL